MGIILHTNGVDSGYRLDCEKLFAPAERPSNPLAWFDMNGPWFQRARETAARLERDATALAEARANGWLVMRTGSLQSRDRERSCASD